MYTRSEDRSSERGWPLDERAVAIQAQRGDQDAFASLVRRYEEVAFRVAYLIVRDEDDARDVAQDAFVRAFRSLRKFDVDQPFRPWLLRIVSNLAINNRRSARRRGEAGKRYEREVERRDGVASPEAEVEAGERAARLWEAMAGLSLDDQRLLYLRYFLEASEAETATVIGKPVGTVKSRSHRVLKRLRGIIEDRYPDLTPAFQSGLAVRAER